MKEEKKRNPKGAGRKGWYGEETAQKHISYPISKEKEFLAEVRQILDRYRVPLVRKGGYIKKKDR